jgi:hypothetical protein
MESRAVAILFTIMLALRCILAQACARRSGRVSGGIAPSAVLYMQGPAGARTVHSRPPIMREHAIFMVPIQHRGLIRTRPLAVANAVLLVGIGADWRFGTCPSFPVP